MNNTQTNIENVGSPIQAVEPVSQAKTKREKDKLQKKLRRLVGQAVSDYGMIEDGDRIMVCLSGGKDSYAMLDMLMSLKRNAPINFDLVAVNLDQKQPDFPEHVLPEYLEQLGVEYHVIEEDTYSIVKSVTPENKTYCPVCSRLRRGILYNFANKIGAGKLALGHHMDDVVETLFLNMFFGGRMKAMPAKLKSDDGAHIVIRPLYYVREHMIQRWAQAQAHPIIPCNLCGAQDNMQRQVIKQMLQGWDKEFPGRVENIARAIRNVSASHLGDHSLFDYLNLKVDKKLFPVIQA